MGVFGLGTQNGFIRWTTMVFGILWCMPVWASDDVAKVTTGVETSEAGESTSASQTETTAEADDGQGDLRSRAREAYALGQEAFVAKDYEAAEDYFTQAYDLIPHPSSLKMIAECYVALGEVAAAMHIFEGLLNDATYPNKDQLRERLSELQQQVCKVDIETIPEGGIIEVNGVILSQRGHATIYVDPGKVRVTVSSSGVERNRMVTLKAGERKKLVFDISREIEAAKRNNQDMPAASGDGEPDARIAPAELGAASEELPKAFWAASAIAGIGLVSGTVFGTMALRDQKDYDDSAREGIRHSGRRAAVIADISFGIALGAAMAGIIVLISDKKKKRSKQQKSAYPSPDVSVYPAMNTRGAGITAGVSF